MPSTQIKDAAWHAERAKGIGSSDAAAVLGLNPHKSQFRLYLEKTGQIEPENINDKIQVKLGNLLEPIVAQLYQEQHPDEKLARVNTAMVSKAYPFMRANLDYRIVKQKALVECKTSGFWAAADKNEWGDFETDLIPIRYIVQVLHELMVADYEVGYLALLADNTRFGRYIVRRNPELEAAIIKGEGEFWQRVQDKNPPALTQMSDVALKYPNAIAKPIHATPELEEIAGTYSDVKRQIKELTAQVEPLQCMIAEFLGENDTLLSPEGNPLLYFRNRATTSFDVKRHATEYPDHHESFVRRGTTRAMTLPKE